MKYTQETFIEKCKNKHLNKYDYSITNFVSCNKKIDIICNTHGIFSQIAKKHSSGNGCPTCANENHRISSNLFIERCNKIHNNKYNYSEVNYINHSTKVNILCKIHGSFSQTPNNHMSQKKGCPKCNGGYKYSFEDFTNKSKLIHSNNFKYNSKNWIDINSKIEITCNSGHTFLQTPSSHLKGNGCQICYNNKRKHTINIFIEKCIKIHDNLYSYDNANYINSKIKITILCNKCNNYFNQRPSNHLLGQGCPTCCNNSISKLETKWLDILNIDKKYRHKTISINTKNYFADAIINNTIYEFYGDYWHGNLNKYNKEEYNSHRNIKFSDLNKSTIERENILKKNGYEIISIWESEFKKLIQNDKNTRNRTNI